MNTHKNGVALIAKPNNSSSPKSFDSSYSHDPEFAQEQRRHESFRTWKGHPMVNLKDMANSGMVYTGDADRTYCFHCAIPLRSWEPHDDPYIEHARFKPSCDFIIYLKGFHFISSCLEFYEIRDSVFEEKYRQQLRHSDNTSNTGAVGIISAGQLQGAATGGRFSGRGRGQEQPRMRRVIRQVAPREIRARLDSDQSKMLLNLGYPRELVGQVIGEQLQTEGDDFQSFDDFVSAVMNAAELLGIPLHSA